MVIAIALALWLLVAPKPWVAAMQVRGKMETVDYVRIYAWIAGAINIALLGVLAAACPWWTASNSTLNSQLSTRPQTPHWFWPLVAVAMAITFCYSLPRMTHGFWDDEELNVRTTLYGKFKPDKKSGEIEFKRFSWLETIYGYSRGPNSHTLFGIVSRACEEAWNSVVRPKGFPLVEWPFRVPLALRRPSFLPFIPGTSATPARCAATACWCCSCLCSSYFGGERSSRADGSGGAPSL